MRDAETTIRREVDRFGGLLRWSEGRGSVTFGVSRLHEDDALRGVLAALAIREALAPTLLVPIGIATGEVLVHLEGGDPADSSATGPPFARATGLPADAAPGEIDVDEATSEATAGSIDVAPGSDAGVHIVRSARLGADEATPDEDEVELVGRASELRTLQDLRDRALRRSSIEVVTVVGEPGVGKSRLTRALREGSTRGADVPAWLVARCSTSGSAGPSGRSPTW